jgi:hypothetical protein
VPHDLDGGGDPVGRDPGAGARFGQRAIVGGLSDVALGFHGGDTVLQGQVSQVGDAAFDSRVKPSKAIFGIGELLP